MSEEKDDVNDSWNKQLDNTLYNLFSKSFLEFYFKWKIYGSERIDWKPADKDLEDIKFFLSWITYEDEKGVLHHDLIQIVLMDHEIQNLHEKMFRFFTLIKKEFDVEPKQTVIKM